MDEETPQQKVRKISISLSKDVLDWVLSEKGDLKVSTFINQVLRNAMERRRESDVREELVMLENRLKKLEEDIHDLRDVRSLNAGKLGRSEHVSILSTKAEGRLRRARARQERLGEKRRRRTGRAHQVHADREYIDRQTVQKELFPKTGSGITNDINYWYNACRSVLDSLIEEGFVVRLGRDKYRWIGDRKHD